MATKKTVSKTEKPESSKEAPKAGTSVKEPAKANESKAKAAEVKSVSEKKEGSSCSLNSGCSTISCKEQKCINAVNQNMLLSAAAGLIPVPGFDIAAVTAIQVRLVATLSKIYEVDFNKDMASSLIVGVISSSGAVSIGRGVAGSLLKSIPVIGPATGAVFVPVTAAAATYAVGQLFVQHFEAGGTLLTFDAKKARKHYNVLFEQGKDVAKNMKDKASKVSIPKVSVPKVSMPSLKKKTPEPVVVEAEA